MTITTEEAERLAKTCDVVDAPPDISAALRSLAAERDALKVENKDMIYKYKWENPTPGVLVLKGTSIKVVRVFRERGPVISYVASIHGEDFARWDTADLAKIGAQQEYESCLMMGITP